MSGRGGRTESSDSAAMLRRSRKILLGQWRELLRLRGEVLKTSEVEAIHDLRVTSRRFRAAVSLFEPWFLPEDSAELSKRVRKLTRALGRLRNLDEALLFFTQHAPPKYADGFQLCRLLTELRSGELARIKEILTAFNFRRLSRIVRKTAGELKKKRSATCGSLLLTAYFSGTSISLFKQIHDLLPVETSPEQRTPRHALRIAIKKWRYFFDIIAPVLKSDYSPTVELLKEYQSILGRQNDVVEFETLLRDLVLSTSEREFAEAALRAEDKLLLKKLAALIDRSPLSYTFLI